MGWKEDWEAKFGDRIRKGKLSADRISKMCGLSVEQARELATFARLKGKAEAQTEVVTDEFLHINDKYVYNKNTDTYVTYLDGVPKPLVLSGDIHREIVRAYSNFDGSPASINEIARTVKLPRNWIVKYLKVHGITHDSEPFSREEILSTPTEELVQESVQIRRAALYKEMEKRKWAETERDAAKWRNLETSMRTMLAEVQTITPLPTLKLKKAAEPYCAVVGLSDFHWGKYSNAFENGSNYDRKIAREILFTAIENVFSNILKRGAPEKILLPIGSDFFHVDNYQGKTTEGTPQDLDGNPMEVYHTGCKLYEELINYLGQIAPVECVLMVANHDRMLGFAAAMYLEAVYRNHPTVKVTVHVDPSPRVYHHYGVNLLGFVHGDGVHKPTDLSGHMAREASKWWHQCPHKTVYTGHRHHEKTQTDTAYNVTVRQLPSLAGTDRWHAVKGYVGSPRSLPVYLHGRDTGMDAVYYYNLMD